MEADNGETEKCSSKVCSSPHLKEQPLLILLELISRRATNLIQLSLELMFVNMVVSKSSECFLGFLFLALDHEPTRTFGKEDDHNGLDGRSHKKD